MEHANHHIDFHQTNSITLGVSRVLADFDPGATFQVFEPGKVERMPRSQCRKHRPREYDLFEDPWPEMYRDPYWAMVLYLAVGRTDCYV